MEIVGWIVGIVGMFFIIQFGMRVLDNSHAAQSRDRSDAKLQSPLDELAGELFRPMSRLIAVKEIVAEHFTEVADGKFPCPAFRQRDLGPATIWAVTRLEALRPIFGFGSSELPLLVDHKSQVQVLTALLEDKPYLMLPQPSGDTVSQTIQAIWQSYLYLTKVGGEVLDRETDPYSLKKRGKDILHSLLEGSRTLLDAWIAYREAISDRTSSLPAMPKTLFDLFYEDITAKTKSLTMSAVYGPSYESNIRSVLKQAQAEGLDSREFERGIALLQAASDPDELQ